MKAEQECPLGFSYDVFFGQKRKNLRRLAYQCVNDLIRRRVRVVYRVLLSQYSNNPAAIVFTKWRIRAKYGLQNF